MKNWILFTITLLVNGFHSIGCGFYPYGEDIRFNLLKPRYINTIGANRFNYTTWQFSDDIENQSIFNLAQSDENTALWYDYFGQKIDKTFIYEVIYKLDYRELNKKSNANPLVRLLHSKNYEHVLKYIRFAKRCSSLNTKFSDPWERSEKVDVRLRKRFIRKALKYATESTDDSIIQKRYAYLAIRMAYYNNDYNQIDSIYSNYFYTKTDLSALDYWALHFKLHTESPSAKRNLDITRVFSHSKEKRFAIYFLYSSEISFDQTLNEAKTDDDKGGVHFFRAARKIDRALEDIQAYNKYSPKGKELNFLVLREINKLEDWILTPHYSKFLPSLMEREYQQENKINLDIRIEKDRLYAKKLAIWMNSIPQSDINDLASWTTMKNYTLFLANDTEGLESKIEPFLTTDSKENDLSRFNAQLYALVSLHNNQKAIRDDAIVQQTIMNETERVNNSFLFAMARELEFVGNTTEAAYLFSFLNTDDGYDAENDSWNYSYWKRNQNQSSAWDDYYSDYFYYLDAAYTTTEMEGLILNFNESNANSTVFEKWKKSRILAEKSRIYDLLGTKYIRENKLEKALESFKQVNDTIWQSDFYPFKTYLNANPFYTDFYTEHSKSIGDTVQYTKEDITRKLIRYIELSEAETGASKAYYCFQVANCYFNMSQFGNSWMMRRYYWSSLPSLSGIIDDDEYFGCSLAKSYYLKSKKASSNKKTQALALRMAGRCEKYRLYEECRKDNFYVSDSEEASIFLKNKYYNQLRMEYPEHYDPLISNCHSFGGYYAELK